MTLTTAVFRLDRDDVRVAETRPGFFVKTGQTRTEGVELGFQGGITSYWQVFGGYSYLNARITQPISSGTTATVASIIPAGNKIGLVPEHMISLWNRVTLGAGWSAGSSGVYQSSYFASVSNTVELPGYARIDAAVYYTFAGGRARLALNVENLLNQKYYPTVDGDNNISPGAPITAQLTLSATF